ncbi:protein of unknown function [Methylorubrum extorquens]|uniref:Uncharacterized protein n=1 Tax=Methylorubrum extorquens TaxID=408 RepID=A0A2N9AHF7_METEX|nr:protein of unknown function [Methylorubrum extorquens]
MAALNGLSFQPSSLEQIERANLVLGSVTYCVTSAMKTQQIFTLTAFLPIKRHVLVS